WFDRLDRRGRAVAVYRSGFARTALAPTPHPVEHARDQAVVFFSRIFRYFLCGYAVVREYRHIYAAERRSGLEVSRKTDELCVVYERIEPDLRRLQPRYDTRPVVFISANGWLDIDDNMPEAFCQSFRNIDTRFNELIRRVRDLDGLFGNQRTRHSRPFAVVV